jgi:signal peptidase I
VSEYQPEQENQPENPDPGIGNGEILTQPVISQVKPNQAAKTGRFLFEALQTILLAVVLYFLVDSVMARVRVENISMRPTLNSGEFILVNKLAYRLGDLHHGDIIVFHYPPDPQQDYIKRIVGLPGDNVRIKNGKVSVNNQELIENYISAPPNYTGEWKVPQGSVFVLGDNRNQSFDSHSWGFVPFENIIGRAIFIYWPLKEIQVLNGPFLVQAANP